MVRSLLSRGMLAGLLAGLVAFVYAHIFAEPLIDQAIAFEDHMHRLAGDSPEPELVSRAVQSTWGLFTGIAVCSTAIGGIFSLVFAFAQGRVANTSPRATAALIGLATFVVLFLVPQIKYPANPPSIGNPETIQDRTVMYFGMIVWSTIGAIGALMLGRRLLHYLDYWNAALCGLAVYIVTVAVAMFVLPAVDEVPHDFPATLLWQFRVISLSGHAVVLSTLSLVFGALAEPRFSTVASTSTRLRRIV